MLHEFNSSYNADVVIKCVATMHRTEDEHGNKCLMFRSKDVTYSITLDELETYFSFTRGTPVHHNPSEAQLDDFWRCISKGWIGCGRTSATQSSKPSTGGWLHTPHGGSATPRSLTTTSHGSTMPSSSERSATPSTLWWEVGSTGRGSVLDRSCSRATSSKLSYSRTTTSSTTSTRGTTSRQPSLMRR